MSRLLLVMLVLLDYLLVVCASVAECSNKPVARAFDYVHSPDCQLKNAWRGGSCFNYCNGVQYHVHKGRRPVPLQQLLTSLKGLDLRCLPAPAGYSALLPLASLAAEANRPAVPAPTDKRGRQRAERARYHTQCRAAMAF